MILDFTVLADLIASKLRGFMQADEALDTRGAAALLKLSENRVLELVAGGEIPGRKLGGVWRFRRSALLDHITPMNQVLPTAAD